jgi:hypothetical protein
LDDGGAQAAYWQANLSAKMMKVTTRLGGDGNPARTAPDGHDVSCPYNREEKREGEEQGAVLTRMCRKQEHCVPLAGQVSF